MRKKKFRQRSEGHAGSPALNAWQRPDGHGWLHGSRLSLLLGLGCPQLPVLWCQDLGRNHLVADIELGVAPCAWQAQSTNNAANGAVGQGDREEEGQRWTKLSGTETIEGCPGLRVPQVNPS